jgi:hypothetical protein
MPGCSGVVRTVIRFCTSARLSSGIARPKRAIIGMPTPTTAPSPRKLLTATVWPGLAIVVKARSSVTVLLSSPVTVTVAV